MRLRSNHNWNILLVDDDEDDYVLINKMLTGIWKDHVVLQWISDPEKAVETLCSRQFDAVILDSHLDHTAGLELIIRVVKSCQSQVLIYLSNWPDRAVLDHAIALGASAALSKEQLSGNMLVNVISDVVMTRPTHFSGVFRKKIQV